MASLEYLRYRVSVHVLRNYYQHFTIVKYARSPSRVVIF